MDGRLRVSVVASAAALLVCACSERALSDGSWTESGGGAGAEVVSEVDLDPQTLYFATSVAIDDQGVVLAYSANNRASKLRWIDADGQELASFDLPDRSEVWGHVPLDGGGWRVALTEGRPEDCNEVNVVDFDARGREVVRSTVASPTVEDPAGCVVRMSRDGSTLWSIAYAGDWETLATVVLTDGGALVEAEIAVGDALNVAPGGELMVIREQEGGVRIEHIAPDGSELWGEDVDAADDRRAAMSHWDGSFDVVTATGDVGISVTHVDADGFADTQSVSGVLWWDSVFRGPNGDLVVVGAGTDPENTTFRITAVEDDGTQRTTVLPSLGGASTPQLAWSPNGEWVAILNDGVQEFYPGRLAIARW